MNITVNESGTKVVEIVEGSIVALVNGNAVQLNQLDPLDPKNGFNYDSVYLTKELILQLADHIKRGDV